MNQENIQWKAPAPLWQKALQSVNNSEDKAFHQPAILRFATDDFMEEFMDVLERDPALLVDLEARRETWRGPVRASETDKLRKPRVKVSRLARLLERRQTTLKRKSGQRIISGPTTEQGNNDTTNVPPLKLFQPAHQRYYLVAACLICGQPGLPDRQFRTGSEETASFVIRRKIPPEATENSNSLPPYSPDWEEFAFVEGPAASGWQAIKGDDGYSEHALVPGEQQIPMFSINYTEDDGRCRRLLAGLIPVGRRETYQYAGVYPPSATRVQNAVDEDTQEDGSPNAPDQRMDVFSKTVAGPWKALFRLAFNNLNQLTENITVLQPDQYPYPEAPPKNKLEKAISDTLKATREQIQTGSWYILLEFADFLKDELNGLWQVIDGSGNNNLNDLNPAEIELYNTLSESVFNYAFAAGLTNNISASSSAVKRSLAEALQAVAEVKNRNLLEREFESDSEEELVQNPYNRSVVNQNWPDFLFPLADIESVDQNFEIFNNNNISKPQRVLGVVGRQLHSIEKEEELQSALDSIDAIAEKVRDALPDNASAPEPILSIANQNPLDPRDGRYVIRCVFERTDCGPLNPALVSEASRPFRMAGFFDPEAPARPIRIGLPLDVSPEGLRNFDKNTAFMMSDMLCGHVKRFRQMSFGDLVRAVLPWPLHKELSVDAEPCQESGGINIGMMCSLSIPIITICALILLIMIVNLLDIVFRWLPYFIVCYPFRGLSSNNDS